MKLSPQRVLYYLVAVLVVVVLTFMIAVLPSLLSFGRPSNNARYANYDDPDFKGTKLYRLHFHPERIWRKPLVYLRQIKDGKIFHYMEGKTPRR